MCLQCRRPWFNSWVGKIPWRRDRLPTPVFLGFPCGSAGKESACNVGDLDLIPELGRHPGEGKGYPLRYSGLENSMDCIVHRVGKSRTRLRESSHQHQIESWFRPAVDDKPSHTNYWLCLSPAFESCVTSGCRAGWQTWSLWNIIYQHGWVESRGSVNIKEKKMLINRCC